MSKHPEWPAKRGASKAEQKFVRDHLARIDRDHKRVRKILHQCWCLHDVIYGDSSKKRSDEEIGAELMLYREAVGWE